MATTSQIVERTARVHAADGDIERLAAADTLFEQRLVWNSVPPVLIDLT